MRVLSMLGLGPTRSRLGTGVWAVSLAFACVLVARVDRAVAQEVRTDQLAADGFQPAPGAGNYIALDGATVGGHLVPSAGLLLDYAHRPLVVVAADCASDTDSCAEPTEVDVVEYEATASVVGSLALVDRVQVGLVLPVDINQGQTWRASTPNFDDPFVGVQGGDGFGLGDPRLSLKVRLVGHGLLGFSLATVAHISAPLGQATAKGRFLGDDGVTAGGHVAGEYRLPRGSFAVNLGGAYRPEAKLLAIEQGSELRYGVGGSFEATPLFRVVTELMGATRFSDGGNPLELRAAGELAIGDVVFTLGGGVGLVSGVGAPDFRVLGGGSYRPVRVDEDRDGVFDAQDPCPAEKEDLDGYLDDDGCPEDDNDSDGIPDIRDQCPNEAEDKDGNQDEDGCPEIDNDGDGIADGYDSCPDRPEDMDGDRDEDGCPDEDRDRDGVPDNIDQCPDEPEDMDGFGDEDGCPEVDFDGDQVPDDDDQCPDEPEDFNGVMDDDGCPEAGEAEVGPEAGDG